MEFDSSAAQLVREWVNRSTSYSTAFKKNLNEPIKLHIQLFLLSLTLFQIKFFQIQFKAVCWKFHFIFSSNLPGEGPHGSSSSSWGFCGDNLSISRPAVLGAENPHDLQHQDARHVQGVPKKRCSVYSTAQSIMNEEFSFLIHLKIGIHMLLPSTERFTSDVREPRHTFSNIPFDINYLQVPCCLPS